jgi:membrane protein implicated in regulation of membrane protease activity
LENKPNNHLSPSGCLLLCVFLSVPLSFLPRCCCCGCSWLLGAVLSRMGWALKGALLGSTGLFMTATLMATMAWPVWYSVLVSLVLLALIRYYIAYFVMRRPQPPTVLRHLAPTLPSLLGMSASIQSCICDGDGQPFSIDCNSFRDIENAIERVSLSLTHSTHSPAPMVIIH